MNVKLEKAQHKFIESIGKLCDSFGLNKLVAQLYGLLYLSGRPLSLDEMAKMLGVSKGSVSLNIRELEKWGAVKNIWVKGSRKDYYEAELDIKKVAMNKIYSGVSKRMADVSSMLGEFKDIIKSAENELNDEEKAIVEIYEKRLQKIEDLKDLAAKALSIAEKVL